MTSINTFVADSEAPIVLLTAKKHFEELPTLNAKLYAHYLSRASHHGTRGLLRSVSNESEAIYDLILGIHGKLGEPKSVEEYQLKLKEVLDSQAVTEYLEYASQFLGNLGNYKSFGDKKFVPKITPEKFEKLVQEGVKDSGLAKTYESIKEALYDTSKGLLGWPENGHVSSYYLGAQPITKAEVEEVNEALASRNIMPENTRVEKVSDSEFVVHVASALTDGNVEGYDKNGISFAGSKHLSFKFGDHSEEFKKIVENLKQAKKYVANETEDRMLQYYIDSFETGSMQAHKKSQIEWVKDLKPDVESNIGFIETYRDPSGVRGEWEGLVAMVNKDRTAKFSVLVNSAEKLIPLLPWDKLYEKDTFSAPDFTSLEVFTFAGSGVPAGINIPNYDDVRLNIGFKNVSLGNVLSANPKNPKKEEVVTFVDTALKDKYIKWREEAFEVQVGLHELLGHGTGKLLQETSPGHFNFDKENFGVSSWYKSTDTWGSLFGSVAGSFEECRAELVALYLILKAPLQVLPIFGVTSEQDQKDVILIATLSMCRAGLLGLEFWDPASEKWGQPHMQARFGIFKSLHQSGVCRLEYSESNFADLKVVVDGSKLHTTAVDALGDFLSRLHVFKSTANVEEGVRFYNTITKVTEDYSKFRDTILSKKLPRKQLIQANSSVSSDNTVQVIEYEESEVGMIQSFYDRQV